MNPEHWNLVMNALAQARARGPRVDDAYLAQICLDEAMVKEVKRLLAADEKASREGFLDPIVSITSAAQDDTTKLAGHSTASCGIDGDDVTGSAPFFPRALDFIGGYQILAKLGHGGMGVVFKARDETLNRNVAIKIPRPEFVNQDKDQQRFLREARAAASLRHPNVCPIYEIGCHEECPYLVMGFIDGQTLDTWAEQHSPGHRKAAQLVAVIARAVEHAHDNDVLHRDIKPSNVMIDVTSNEPILMDFGLAKELAQESEMTVTGQLMGTPAYMAPEQASGRANRSDRRLDVYGLGALLYYLITARPPFKGNMAVVLHQVQHVEPPAPRKFAARLDRDLETICLKAISKEADARYASAGELAADLERFLAGESILARREGILGKVRRTFRRRPVVASVFLAGTALIAMLIMMAGNANRDRKNTEKVDRLTRQINARMASDDWSESQLRELERMVESVDRISPTKGNENRQLVYQELARSIKELIEEPRLESSDVDRIKANLVLLADRDALNTAALRRALTTRLLDWQPVFEVSTPFDEQHLVFPARVRVENGMLVSDPPQGNEILTTRGCQGNVRMNVEFSEHWMQDEPCGIMLGPNASRFSGDRGYKFIVKLRSPRKIGATLPSAGQPPGKLKLRVMIMRGDELLREDQMEVPPGPLRLMARRELDRLTFQVNDVPPFEFLDAFPVTDHGNRVFGLLWPPGVAVRQVRASEQKIAPDASPLERGDELYKQGAYADALAEFEKQAIQSGGSIFGQEARVKQALCLVKLSRRPEAIPLLSQCSAAQASRWSALARCQLMTLQLEKNEYQQAFANFKRLALEFRPEEIRPLIPANFNRAVLEKYQQDGSGIYLLAYSTERIENLNRAYAIQQYFGEIGPPFDTTRLYLCRANYLGGDTRTAWDIVAKLVEDHPALTIENQDRWFEYWETYLWLSRINGNTQGALDAVNRCLYDDSGEYVLGHLPLLLERSRIHVALDDWSAAEKDIRAFLDMTAPSNMEYRHFSSAHLMLGFLLERRGDNPSAFQSWQQGLPTAFPNFDWLQIRHTEDLVNALALASLTDNLSAMDIQLASERIIRKLDRWLGSIFVRGMLNVVLRDFPSERIATMVHRADLRPGNRTFVREIAFRSKPPDQLFRQSFGAVTVEIADEAIEGELSTDDLKLAEELGDAIYLNYYQGNLIKEQLLAITFTWSGIGGFGTWEEESLKLDAALRGSLAYGFGHRYMSLGRTADALLFFQQAAQDSEPESRLERLATQAIAKLSSTAAPRAAE